MLKINSWSEITIHCWRALLCSLSLICFQAIGENAGTDESGPAIQQHGEAPLLIPENSVITSAKAEPSIAPTEHEFLPTVFPVSSVNTVTEILQTEASPASQMSERMLAPSKVVGQVVGGLVLVCGIILVLAWLARRMGYGNLDGAQSIRVLANMPLGSREKAVLVEINGKQLLLGVAPGRVNFLHEFENSSHQLQSPSIEPTNKNVQATDNFPIKKGQEFARYLKTILAQGNKP